MRRWILAATILGSAMAFIDGSVVNVALPVLQKSIRATVTDAQWIVDAYLLVLASLLLAGGALGDRLGRMRVFAAGVVVFGGASAWCGAAPDARHLIAARALQGIGGALLVPGSLAIITATYPAGERGKAIGTWSAMTSLAAIAGPVLGGWLVQAVSWRAVFFINIPMAAATLLIVWRARSAKEEDGNKTTGGVDWAGTTLITLALASLTFALIEMPSHRISGMTLGGAFVVSVATFVAFLFVEGRVEKPIVPLHLFRSRTFTAVNIFTLMLYAAVTTVTFLLPFNLIQLQGYSPAGAGAAFLPFVATMSLLSRWTGALADRVGARPLLVCGPLITAAGFLLTARPRIGGSYWTTFFPGILLIGLGMAVTVAPLTATVMSAADDDNLAGTVSGINNTVARAAGLLAIAVSGTLSIIIFAGALERSLVAEPPAVRSAMAAQTTRLAEAEPPRGVDDASVRRIRDAVKRGFLRAFRFNVLGSAALAVAASASALMIESRPATEKTK